ncbi:AAA family ATPase [Myroides odoratimimus]|uniref:AAA family ATPase n=1 Tax=Myroides odoratimimus TaxID=76832 RepID=UPI0029C0135C|nr:AAA family ATPase [Myroides odoratimimus]MDX4975395.1 AAA family ATPase [Myroides odoratimimus]
MIKIEKQNAPSYLNSSIVDLAIEKMGDFFAAENRNQKRYDWPFNKEIDKELKEYLHKVFHGKCGYCEIKIDYPELGTVDRYRPNNGVRDKNEFYQDLYWWLTFEWDNLIYACKECNQYKGNYFPIKGRRALNERDDYENEHRMLLNPYLDETDKHLNYIHSNDSHIYALTNEGNQTIELLRLNRTNLLEGRKKAKKKLIEAIESLVNGEQIDNRLVKKHLGNIYNLEDPSIEFLSYKRFVLLNELDTEPFLGQIIGLEDFQTNDDWFREKKTIRKKVWRDLIKSDYFPIEYIHIKNFKSIDDLRIDFKEDELNKKSWLFLLGENGVGKSSILQAIAVGLKLDKNLIDPLIPSLIKKGKRTAEITIKERNNENIIYTKLVRKTGTVEQSGSFNSYLIGYGSLRLSVDEIESSSPKDISKISYQNLFKPTKALNDVTKWLRSIHRTDRDFFDRIAISIKQLLPHDKSDTNLSIKNGEIILGNSETLFSELSDGYKSTITLAIDIMMKLSDAQSDMKVMSGIVLIDELGNQLHPRWQMRIVRQLREVFPNINFIVSTHHPLCLRGAERKEILLLRNIDNQVISNTELPDPASLRVDQILASEFFGLSSLVDPEIEAKFNRYYELLAKNNDITPNERIEIDKLKDFLRNKKQLGASLREELMFTVIDRLLAEKVAFNKNTFDRVSLKEEAVQRVKDVWKNLNLDIDD